MKMTHLSPTARTLYGAIWTFVTPRLAQDQSIPGLNNILSGVTAANLSSQIPNIARKVRAATRRKLAMDSDLDDLDDMLGEFEAEHENGEGQEEHLSAAEAFQQFKQLLERLGPDEASRFVELLRDYGAVDPDGEPGGTINPYNEAGDRRRARGAKDQPPSFPSMPRTNVSTRPPAMDAASSSEFARRYPSASKILIT
jgi:hypothetical protein